jgi:hypothetical protein
MPAQKAKLPRVQYIELAVRSQTDPRTVQKYYEGDSVRRAQAAAVQRALAEVGIADPRAPKKAGAK